MAVKVETQVAQRSGAEVLGVPMPKTKKGARLAHGGLDRALGGQVKAAVANGAFSGRVQETRILVPTGGVKVKRVVLCGIGDKDEFSEESVRRAVGAAARVAGRAASVAIALHAVPGDGARAAEAAVVGWRLGSYKFTKFKSDRKKVRPARLALMTSGGKARAVRAGAKIGTAVADGVVTARDLGNNPGNYMTPTILARAARAMAQSTGLKSRVLTETQMRALGMGSLLSVSRGSVEPAKLILLEHGRKAKNRPTVCLVGKGLTFDTGGISMKPPGDMDKMRYDMCGGAAVVGTMEAVARLKLPLHVVGVVPSSENMPDAKATKPGDIVTAMNGKTIEVLNTDAEGRLILADALCYAQRYKPELIIDLATLTGAVLVALGKHMAGMMGTDESSMAGLQSAGKATHERVWQLPLDDDYDAQVRGRSADLQNIGGRNAGTVTAAQFLRHFTGDLNWIHLDIAGTAWDDPTRIYNKGVGATGYGVRLLTRFLQERAGR